MSGHSKTHHIIGQIELTVFAPCYFVVFAEAAVNGREATIGESIAIDGPDRPMPAGRAALTGFQIAAGRDSRLCVRI